MARTPVRDDAQQRTVRDFSKRGDGAEIPDLTKVQRDAYERFLQIGCEPSKRNKEIGLESLLHEIFPIESYDETMKLEYVQYELEQPRYTADECRELRLTYGLPFKLRLRLQRKTDR